MIDCLGMINSYKSHISLTLDVSLDTIIHFKMSKFPQFAVLSFVSQFFSPLTLNLYLKL
jgi:hypothetical protein